MNDYIIDKINNADLTDMERNAVDKLVRTIEKTAFMSGSQMAEMCGISPASMTRLARKLGYNKLSDFKTELTEAYKKSVQPSKIFQNYMTDDRQDSVISNSISKDLENISKMESMIDSKTIDEIADVISNTRKVYVTGMFSSEIIVRAFCHYLWRLGIKYRELMGIGLSKKVEYADIQKGDV